MPVPREAITKNFSTTWWSHIIGHYSDDWLRENSRRCWCRKAYRFNRELRHESIQVLV
jgi:hypothetical protein